MSVKKEKGNILNDLLGGSDHETDSRTDELRELIYRKDESGNKALPKPSAASKKKVTHYLSEKVSVELSEAKAKIKVMVPPELKSRVSMSKIVEFAVKGILEELHKKGNDSSLVKKMMENGDKD